MEPDVPPIKLHTGPLIPPDRSRRRKNVEADSVSDINAASKPDPQMMIQPSTPVESGQDSPVLTETTTEIRPAVDGRIDNARKTQISTSRAITVELNTLRDLMPKLKREIHTYSINECQLVKELETKLPSCLEHKDVRLNLVLEEIQRLRINKRKALRRLNESQIRIVELESGMELSSYEAGELFWDSKITRLSGGDYSARLNILAAAIIEEKKSKENFSFTPVTRATSYEAANSESSITTTGTTQSGMAGRKSGQGYIIESTRNVTPHKVAAKTPDVKNQSMMLGAAARIAPNTNNSATEVAATGAEADRLNNSQSGTSSLNLHEKGHKQAEPSAGQIDLEKIVTEAQRRREAHRNFRKRNLLIAILPVGVVVGLLVLDWQTGFLSTLLSPLIGK